MLFKVSSWVLDEESMISVGPVTTTTVTALSSRLNPLSTWYGGQGLISSCSAIHIPNLVGRPMKFGSPAPALQYPILIRHRRSARPMAVLALFTTPGPIAEVP